jgi:hypothetical protein
MGISITCPCGKTLHASTAQANTVIVCVCGRHIVVPAQPSAIWDQPIASDGPPVAEQRSQSPAKPAAGDRPGPPAERGARRRAALVVPMVHASRGSWIICLFLWAAFIATAVFRIDLFASKDKGSWQYYGDEAASCMGMAFFLFALLVTIAVGIYAYKMPSPPSAWPQMESKRRGAL